MEWAKPRVVETLGDCSFYHKMDLPGHGLIEGRWDIRNAASQYLGNYNFSGKRALDVGAASGYLSFEMERQGAEVVSFDIPSGDKWDIVPHYKLVNDMPKIHRSSQSSYDKFINAYWLSHKALGSKAKAYYGDIYRMPDELGKFDAVFYGMILTHLRDPFQALYSGSRLCRDTMIVTGIFGEGKQATALFRPDPEDVSILAIKGWWALSRVCVEKMLGVLGFRTVDRVKSNVYVNSPGVLVGEKICTAIVAKRGR